MTRSLIRFWNALSLKGSGVRPQAARDELERRVQERTAELLAANKALQAEILARGHVEDALRESEARFRSTFKDAPIGMTLVSADNRILQTNRAHSEFLGYSEQELTGMSILDVTYPEDREATSRVSRQMREGGARIERHQKRYVRKNGDVVWGEVSVSVIRDADGKLSYTIAQIVDITEQRRAEEALRRSEALFRVITDNAQDAIFLKDREGRLLFVNPVALAIVGGTAENVIGKTAEQIHTDPEFIRVIRENDQRLMNSDKMEALEETVHGPMGTRTYLTVKVPYHDGAGRVIGLVGTARDITDRKRAEQALRASEQRYRELFEASPTALVEEDWAFVRQRSDQLRAEGVTDVRAWFLSHPEEALLCFHRIQRLDVNKAALRLFKATGKKELLVNFDRLGYVETRDTVISAVATLAAGNEFFEAEASLRTLTGERRNLLMSISATPAAEESLPRYIVSLSDVTDLRKAQQEAIEQRQAAQLQRMESLAVTGRLAAGVAHEINNPLQGIIGQLSLLAGELPEPLRQGRRIVLIHDGIDRIAGIVRNLLQLHRPAPAGEESCAASSVIPGLTDMISSIATNQHIRLEVFVTPPEMTVPMSANALTQVLLNLVLNAIDAMPKGGVMRIEARQTRQEVLVSVSDTGVGIPSEYRTRLFSPFFTTKGPKGTGLGLSVTHSLVTSAGGTIAATDHKGGGTTFAIRFENERSEI
ncbi:MAG: PAS domain S-box protein [Candidatus Brocadiia bacterium]|jgi:PAS domain S-box-containing protein